MRINLFIVFLLITFLVGGIYIGRYPIFNSNSSRLDKYNLKCKYYGFPDEEGFFPAYTVKPGDTLLSIAQNQLGDTQRVEELIKLNIRKHTSIGLDNPFIEVGWELLLPPDFVTNSSGGLYIHAGEFIERKDQARNSIVPNDENIAIIYYDGGFKSSLVSRKTPSTVYLGKESFKTGDCVFVLVDSGTRHVTALAVSPQDRSYFK